MISQLLIYAAAPLAVLYFYLFNKSLKMLDKEERQRLIAIPSSRLSFPIVLVLLGSFVYFDHFGPRLALAAAILGFGSVASYRQHKKFDQLGFDPAYTRFLRKISYISDVGISLILLAGILSAVGA
jgi:hypothetical protein